MTLSPRSSSFSASAADAAWMNRIDLEQVFVLIDRLLPLEACLYHQMLPLDLAGSQLELGMVNPQDTVALGYVKRMLSYINCTITTTRITSVGHRHLLTQYLNRMPSSVPLSPASEPATMPPADTTVTQPPRPQSPQVRGASTRQPSSRPSPPAAALQATYIVDSPDELDDVAMHDIHASHTAAHQTKAQPKPSSISAESANPETTVDNLGDRPAALAPPAAPRSAAPIFKASTATASPLTQPTLRPVPELRLRLKYLEAPLTDLLNLPPRALLRELLGRVLQNGIGRLYLENHGTHGRIVWSQDGVMQSVLEQIPADLFQAVIYNLKRFAALTAGSTPPQQIELERMYLGERLLLRLRLMRGHHGEEATIQVLRGAALKFYNQQQLDKLGSDALILAHRLQTQIQDIRDRAQALATGQPPTLDALQALRNVLHQLDHEVEGLMQRQTNDR